MVYCGKNKQLGVPMRRNETMRTLANQSCEVNKKSDIKY